MLSDEEIVRRLTIIRFSPTSERNARRAPSINGTATEAGLSRQSLFRIINGTKFGKHARTALSRVLENQ